MRLRTMAGTFVVVAGAATAVSAGLAQAPAPGRGAARGTAAPPPATVLQVMRGILYPASNVVFAAQAADPEAVPKPPDPSTSPNLLASTYGGWEAVANSAIALNESARLLEVARMCSNGKRAPIQSATWKKGISQLRAAGLDAYKAARMKSQDAVLDAAEKITTACSTCHDTYREKTPRCTE